MTVDLDAVPRRRPATSSSSGSRGARRVLAVGHENPDADTLGAALGVVPLVEALGGRADAGLHRPGPAAVRLPARRRARPDRSRPGTRLRPARRRRTAARSTGSAPSASATPSCSSGCRGSSSTTTPRTTRPARPTGSIRAAAATCEMVALLAARLGVPLDAGDGALAAALMAGIVMDTATFAHPERDAADARRLGGARRGRRAAVGHLAPALPHEARRAAAAVRPRPRPARDRRRRPDRLVDAAPTPTSPRPAPIAPHSEGIIDLLAQAEDAEVAILFKEAGRRRRGSASGRSRAASTRRS